MSVYDRPGWYRLTLADGWTAEEVDGDEGLATISRAEGPGALQVTAQAPRPLPEGGIDLLMMMRAFVARTGTSAEEAGLRDWEGGGLKWVAAEYAAADPDDGEVIRWRLWMATNDDLIVFLTYGCPEESAEVEREAVEAIVTSLDVP